jgi:hypothetical protein
MVLMVFPTITSVHPNVPPDCVYNIDSSYVYALERILVNRVFSKIDTQSLNICGRRYLAWWYIMIRSIYERYKPSYQMNIVYLSEIYLIHI